MVSVVRLGWVIVFLGWVGGREWVWGLILVWGGFCFEGKI